MDDSARQQFEQLLVPEELAQVARRRELADPRPLPEPTQATVRNDLVGLAVSGGGIRSATFALGVVQGLSQHGILRQVDYLSTVSGGGYLGSCISSLLNRPPASAEADRFPLRYTRGSGEPPALTHLRNSSNYLRPQGLLNALRIPVLLLRGILLNLCVFLPYIIGAVLLTQFVYLAGPDSNWLPLLVLPLLLVFVLLAITFPIAQRVLRRRLNWHWRDRFERWLAVPLMIAVASVLLMPLLNLTRLAIERNAGQLRGMLEGAGALHFWQLGVGFAVLLLVLSLLGRAATGLAPWVGRIFVGLMAIVGPVVLFTVYLALCLWQIESPYLPYGSETVLNRALVCKEEACLVEGAAYDQRKRREDEGIMEMLQSLFQVEHAPRDFGELVVDLRGRGLTLNDQARVFCAGASDCQQPPADWREDRRIWVITDAPGADNPCPKDAGAAAPGGYYCHYIGRGSAEHLRILGLVEPPWRNQETLLILLLLLLVILFNRYFLDINTTSPHGFYRDRLSRAFLIREGAEDTLEMQDGLKLSELNAPDSVAPYHLINTALNLQAEMDPQLRGRESDFFLFSRLYSGSRLTGYVSTVALETADPHLDLGTAMAISGAAAAPNAGRQTRRSLSFVLTLLNIRLGYWLPNPRRVARRQHLKRLRAGCARPSLIWREALGLMDARHSHVNVSDGGHIENLAIYELLRRRCRLIIAIDGEHDPGMQFDGLVTLLRFARIDLGVEVDFSGEDGDQLGNLRLGGDGHNRSHWALGTIHYGDGETGQLLYIKLSYTGDEPPTVRAYREQNPEFPHEPTADQFFTESQFEAYRALGEHISEGLLRAHAEAAIFANPGGQS